MKKKEQLYSIVNTYRPCFCPFFLKKKNSSVTVREATVTTLIKEEDERVIGVVAKGQADEEKVRILSKMDEKRRRIVIV